MSSAAGSVRRHDPAFLRARLGSALGIAPLGIWSVVHLWHNLAAFRGGAEWERAVTEYDHPAAFFFSSLCALLPLTLHTIWGVSRLASARPNNLSYRTYANLKYTLQRLSAIGLVLFLGAHVWKALLEPRMMHGRPETFAAISHEVHHHVPTLAVYVLGVLGTAYHLANGVQTFAMGWGIVTSRGALRRLEILIALFFVALLAMGWGVIFALWSAGT